MITDHLFYRPPPLASPPHSTDLSTGFVDNLHLATNPISKEFLNHNTRVSYVFLIFIYLQ